MDIKKITQKAAFDMFRGWAKEAAEKFPSMNFSILDETCLVNNINKIIQDAVKALFDAQRDNARKIPGFSIGFMHGYIQSSVSILWNYEYIQQQTDDYKYLMATKAILAYLEVDEPLNYKLDALYKELFSSINLENIAPLPKTNIDFLQKFNLSQQFTKNRVVAQVLESRKLQLVEKFANNEPPLSIETEDYLTDEEIQFIIDYYSVSL